MQMKSHWLWFGVSVVFAAGTTQADGDRDQNDEMPRPQGKAFERVATFPVYANNADAASGTVAEIVAVSKDGNTLVYTDAELGVIGFLNLTYPHMPVAAGTLELSGSPTSVAVLGNRYVLAAVDTSDSFVAPSGHLKVFDLRTRAELATIDLGGQPDSIAISGDEKYAAIVLENQRDEDIEVNGEEGGLPQLPSGALAILDLAGMPSSWTLRSAALTGLSDYAPTDAEAEFVDINERNEAVVTLQENNHVVVVDLKTGRVVDDFPAGSVDLVGIDAEEDALIELDDSLAGVPREPDAVAWIPGGGAERREDGGWYGRDVRDLIATANEGDLFGGSRGFSIFDRSGHVLYDSGASFEEIAVRHGHYNEDRSENKGSEPEAIEYGRFGDEDYLFVGSERGSFVAVYTLHEGRPRFAQLLPAPLGPEGLLAIPSRGLLVVSGEVDSVVEDDEPLGVRSTIMIYELQGGPPSYPQIVSANDAGKPIGWSALSGMAALSGHSDRMLAVWDSYYSQGKIFTIDAAKKPAVVTDAVTIQGGSGNFDNEGIAIAPDGTYWLASEGNAGSRRNRLLQTDTLGIVISEIGLPAEIEACRALSTTRGTLGSGFEGVAVVPKAGGYLLAVAQQRGWNYTTTECEALDDNPASDESRSEPRYSRIWLYDPSTGEWDHVAYELEPLPQSASWVGLSEITRVGTSLIVIERDNRTGDFGELKSLVKFTFGDAADGMVSRDEKAVFDLVPAMMSTNGWITDKPEGVAVTGNGDVYVVTDNDGVDGWSGETSFLRLGNQRQLFR
jgi:DNA-binding beta-propeller fold protein YncE